jgi:hypothetical protein
MSRGHGRVERLILAGVGAELVPLMEIARDAGYDIDKRSVQRSFKRAADSLCSQGLIGEQWVWLGGRFGDRQILCVRTPGPDIDEAAAEQRCEALYPKAKSVSQAEFVMAMIEQGRWVVCDALTGGRVDHHAAWLASPD